MIDWVRIEERTPELGDYSVLIWFEDGDKIYVNTPEDLL